VLALVGATAADTVWRGGPDEHITDLFPGRVTGVAFTVGRSCRAARAMLVTDRRREGVELLPDADRSRALGWLDDRHVLAASGGCGGRLDLYSVDSTTLAAKLLVTHVDAAAVRRPEQLPPPPLSPQVLGAKSSFA